MKITLSKILQTLFLISIISSISSRSLADSANDPFALTISGGISLGIYEAGVNWAVVESLRLLRSEEDSNIQFATSTGASAGAINTLITALRYCEADVRKNSTSVSRNLFFNAWDIGLADLLPRSDKDYKPLNISLRRGIVQPVKDSVFSRGKFKAKLDLIKEKASSGKFRAGCEFDIAVVVTQTVPEVIDLDTTTGDLDTTTGSKQVAVQRFVIPISIIVPGADGEITTGLTFRNNTRYVDNSDVSRHLLLPEVEGKIDFDVVSRAILASSAFPFVFGRVELQYCYKHPDRALRTRTRGQCPKNHFLRTGFFLDGGVFDNVPVGAAVNLVRSRYGAEGSGNYIYLDPGNTTVALDSAQSIDDVGDLSITDQVAFTAPIATTLRSQFLTSTLNEEFNSTNGQANRDLFVSRRSMTLIGSYLGGFGAFFDKAFFRHDYAAGVFDGITNVVDYLCNSETTNDSTSYDCSGLNGPEKLYRKLRTELLGGMQKKETLYADNCNEQSCDDLIISSLIEHFEINAADNFHGASTCYLVEPVGGQQRPKEVLKHLAIFQSNCDAQVDDFASLLYDLDNRRVKGKGFFKKYSWEYDPYVEYILGKRAGPWMLGLVEQAVYRLHRLESSSDGENKAALSAVWAVFPGSDMYSVERSPLKKITTILLPNYVGLDGFQSGIVLSWNKQVETPELNCGYSKNWRTLRNICKNNSLFFGLETHFRRVENESDKFNTASAFTGANFNRPDNFFYSSWGLRLKRSVDIVPPIDRREDTNNYASTEVYFRFFGQKLELSLGFRGSLDSIGQDDVTLRIGINDIFRFLGP